MLLILVLKGAKLSASPYKCRKKALQRDLIISIDNTDYISSKSVIARRLASPIVALMPIKVIILASSKNSLVKLTRKEQLQREIRYALQFLKRLIIIVTYTSYCYKEIRLMCKFRSMLLIIVTLVTIQIMSFKYLIIFYFIILAKLA